jgi:peptide/nickel transport system substrate-binding protein
MFSTAYQSGSSWNENHQAIPHFDDLLVAARAETDETKRAEMYAEMQQIVHDDGGQIVLIFNSIIAANTTSLAHGEIAGNWEVDGLRLAEKWWFVEPEA